MLWIPWHRNIRLFSCLLASRTLVPTESHPDHAVEMCERICAFMRSKGFAPCRGTEMLRHLMKARITASDIMSCTHRFPCSSRGPLPTPVYLRPGSTNEHPNGIGIRLRRDMQEVRVPASQRRFSLVISTPLPLAPDSQSAPVLLL